jgi:hypothetical protein
MHPSVACKYCTITTLLPKRAEISLPFHNKSNLLRHARHCAATMVGMPMATIVFGGTSSRMLLTSTNFFYAGT